MAMLEDWLGRASGVVWGPAMLALLFGTAVYLTVGLRGATWRGIPAAFRLLWRGRASREAGDITPFQALMTALSATIGTGNIAGVATAIALGGPGAVFWMWMMALFGMATKYAEAVLAASATELACTMLPMPKAATIPKAAKSPPSQAQAGPMPARM